MSLQFCKQEGLTHCNEDQSKNIYNLGKLAYAFAALYVQFSENQSAARKMIEKHGIRLFRTHVIEVKTSEELEHSILTASMQIWES
jgi:hypothetical protein